uniref:Secreted protein n=1 Tax=Tetradesmus obliquus TaxID=3088 RepID=A0A383VXQ7_TETOB|eukprot:jgi/Sobl393_1/13505/SZX69544.1
MLSLKGCALAGLLLLCGALQAQAQAAAASNAAGADAASLTLQFDNRKSSVLDGAKRQKVLNALAKNVFLVAPGQVSVVSGLDQSGILRSQSVVTFRAVGPTTNRKSVLANCQENTRGRLLGLRNSVAENEIKKATDTWWPGDSVEIQKATCAA